MTNRTVAILGVAAAVMVVAALVVGAWEREPEFVFIKGRYLVDGLNVDRIGSIVIRQGKKRVELEKREDGFYVATRNNYPASASTVNGLIRHVLDLRCAREVTSNPAFHSELGVDPDSGTVVSFIDHDGAELTGVIIGETKEEEPGPFIRRTSADTVYVSEEPMRVQTDDIDYVNKVLLEVTEDEIRSVTVSYPGGRYVIERPTDGGDPVLQDPPEGQTVKKDALNPVFNAATSIRFDDFESESAIGDLSFDRKYEVVLASGAVYHLELSAAEDDYFLKARARFTGPDQVSISQDESEEELKKKEKQLLASEEVETFNTRHRSWVYRIPQWKGDTLTTPLDDLLGTPENDQPEEAEEPSGIEG